MGRLACVSRASAPSNGRRAGRFRRYRFGMAIARRTVTVQLDEDLVERARERSGRDQAKDAEVVEEALAVYLGMKALDEAQAESSLSEEEASKLAYDELRALRQERRGAA
jgi:ATP-dependent exoDNAse (exonuclease V) alpha subunit